MTVKTSNGESTTDATNDGDLLTTAETAVKLRKSAKTILFYFRSGKIEFFRNGRDYFTKQKWIDEYLARETSRAKSEIASSNFEPDPEALLLVEKLQRRLGIKPATA